MTNKAKTYSYMCEYEHTVPLINFKPFKQAYEKWTDEEKSKYDKLEPVVNKYNSYLKQFKEDKFETPQEWMKVCKMLDEYYKQYEILNERTLN